MKIIKFPQISEPLPKNDEDYYDVPANHNSDCYSIPSNLECKSNSYSELDPNTKNSTLIRNQSKLSPNSTLTKNQVNVSSNPSISRSISMSSSKSSFNSSKRSSAVYYSTTFLSKTDTLENLLELEQNFRNSCGELLARIQPSWRSLQNLTKNLEFFKNQATKVKNDLINYHDLVKQIYQGNGRKMQKSGQSQIFKQLRILGNDKKSMVEAINELDRFGWNLIKLVKSGDCFSSVSSFGNTDWLDTVVITARASIDDISDCSKTINKFQHQLFSLEKNSISRSESFDSKIMTEIMKKRPLPETPSMANLRKSVNSLNLKYNSNSYLPSPSNSSNSSSDSSFEKLDAKNSSSSSGFDDYDEIEPQDIYSEIIKTVHPLEEISKALMTAKIDSVNLGPACLFEMLKPLIVEAHKLVQDSKIKSAKSKNIQGIAEKLSKKLSYLVAEMKSFTINYQRVVEGGAINFNNEIMKISIDHEITESVKVIRQLGYELVTKC